jgi:hypothetical protein
MKDMHVAYNTSEKRQLIDHQVVGQVPLADGHWVWETLFSHMIHDQFTRATPQNRSKKPLRSL